MSRALADDPDNADLVRRTCVLRVSEGRVAGAVPVGERIGALERNGGLAQIVVLLQEVKAGDFAAARERARLLPSDGAQRLSAPLLTAWCEMGLQHRAPALQALDALNDVRGVQTLHDLHAAMIADYADRIGEADDAYKKLLAGQAQPTWRAVEGAGNFYERHQRSEEARRLYKGLAAGGQGVAVVAPALQRIARGEVPPRVIASPQEGMAEAPCDLATILDQRETLDPSLTYPRPPLHLPPTS